MTFRLIHGQYPFRACDCVRAHTYNAKRKKKIERKFSSLYFNNSCEAVDFHAAIYTHNSQLFSKINSIVLQ